MAVCEVRENEKISRLNVRCNSQKYTLKYTPQSITQSIPIVAFSLAPVVYHMIAGYLLHFAVQVNRLPIQVSGYPFCPFPFVL